MHPPQFSIRQRLSDWPDCLIETHCTGCGAKKMGPVKMLQGELGDVTFAAVLPRLKCATCGSRLAPVYLCASHHRTFAFGPTPDWAVELVPRPTR